MKQINAFIIKNGQNRKIIFIYSKSMMYELNF